MSHFSYATFFSHPLHIVTFGFLVLTILSFWIHNKIYLWLPLIGVACTLAYFAKIIRPGFFIPLVFLFACYSLLRTSMHPFGRFMVCLFITLISAALSLHLSPDVSNWMLGQNIQISSDAPAFTYYWNFDKPFIAIIPLALYVPLMSSFEDIKRIFLRFVIFGTVTIVVLLILSLGLSLVRVDFKLPLFTPIWMIGNLFFAVIPEEVFFRGFLQREITAAIPSRFRGYIAIFLVAIGFALCHIYFLDDITYLSLTFVASILYGLTYHFTQRVEACIAAHFLLNVIHFIFFTYPILK